MRDETSQWLEPMLNALPEDDPSILRDLMTRASMPAAEADSPLLDWVERQLPQATATTRAIDWIRFGQLLREHLDWDDYPNEPER